LGSTLINPYNLSEQQVNLHLQKGTQMLIGLSIEDMYVYYAVAAVHATAILKALDFLLKYRYELPIGISHFTKHIPYLFSMKGLRSLFK
jgi:hypothetical protein